MRYIDKTMTRHSSPAAIIALLAMTVQLLFGGRAMSEEPPGANAAGPDEKQPLKVYILAGQSNMEGHAQVGTFPHIGMDPKTAPMLKEMTGPDGKPRVLDDVYISYGKQSGKLAVGYAGAKHAPKIGPEYTFGIYLHKGLREPFLIIKTAWGGKSLISDFRPPSAGEWTPPPGHPDLVKVKVPKPLPVPDRLDIPVGYKPGPEYLDPYAKWVGFNINLPGMRGSRMGEHNGVHPIYVCQDPRLPGKEIPLRKGDVIVGVNGEGVRFDPIDHWRSAMHQARTSTWMLKVTRWREGEIETFDIDLAELLLPGGRADVARVNAEQKQKQLAAAEKDKDGHYYRLMMSEIKAVLGDLQSVHPDYDAEPGYEIAGFVWFQGWNDMVDGAAYPNRDKPRGYEQYSWLLAHFIRDVRQDLHAPEMPFVIGVMGVGGVKDAPDYFRQAMAAPADYPEFKGNVKAVYTEKYWDEQLDELYHRAESVDRKRRELAGKNGLEGKELDKAVEEYAKTVMTPEEWNILSVGRSNKGFHYLGSAKIIAGIGQGFAEAMLELQAKRNGSE